MFQNIDISKLYTFDVIVFFAMLWVFIISRYFIRADIEKKEHAPTDMKKLLKQEFLVYAILLLISAVYIASLFFDIEVLARMVRFWFSILILYIISLALNRQVLLLYWKEVEVSGQKYFKKWYEASLFSLWIYGVLFFVWVFLCIKIFELDTFIEIWGLWAWILAFMWFTAPVWAIDMIAGIIILQSKNFETGQVYYLYERNLYVWIKSISLTEVKCIDLKFWNPIMFRPSDFRNLAVKNLSQGISGKSPKIMREMSIHIDYKQDLEDLKILCYEAFDTMIVDLLWPDMTNYFGDEPYRSVEVSSFGDYAIEYKLFYTITSPFYIFKAERLLNEYLLVSQKSHNIYFSSPDLLQIQKKESL